MITRRGLIGGLAAFIAAPAIIKVAQIMPIKAYGEITVAQFEHLRAALLMEAANIYSDGVGYVQLVNPSLYDLFNEAIRDGDAMRLAVKQGFVLT